MTNNHAANRFIKPGKYIFTSVLLCTIFTIAVPSSGARKRTKGAAKMTSSLYPVQFADHRNSSFCDITAPAKGDKVWFLPTADTVHRNMPRLILLHRDGVLVEYPSWIEFIRPDGNRLWRNEIEPGFHPVVSSKGILFRDSPSGLRAVNEKNETVLHDFFVPNSSQRGRFDLVVPVGEHFFIQTFNLAEEPVEEEEEEDDTYSIMLMGSHSYDDWKYLHEKSGNPLPALVTSDGSQAVIVVESAVGIHDIATGKMNAAFSIPDILFLHASLDRDNNLVALVQDNKAKKEIRSYTLAPEKDKQPLWSFSVSGTTSPPFCQPPATDNDNRVYMIQNNHFYAIDKGKKLWSAAITQASYFQYFTILGDNTILCASANILLCLKEGEKPRIVFALPSGEDITTPPVVDDRQQIYFGTPAGIYCIK